MKTLGLIGGTSWHSTVEYYRIINQQVNERLGGANSAKMLLYSVNFEELKPPADWSGWIEIANKLTVISNKLQVAGADCVIICSNTPHIVADLIQHRRFIASGKKKKFLCWILRQRPQNISHKKN